MRRSCFARALGSRWISAACVVVFLLGVTLWVHWRKGEYRGWHEPALALSLPGIFLQLCSDDGVVQFVAYCQSSRAPFAAYAHRRTHIGNEGSYPNATALQALGFTLAFRLTTYNGGDYFVPPYLAVAVPYWFIVFGSLATLPVSLLLHRRARGKSPPQPNAPAT